MIELLCSREVLKLPHDGLQSASEGHQGLEIPAGKRCGSISSSPRGLQLHMGAAAKSTRRVELHITRVEESPRPTGGFAHRVGRVSTLMSNSKLSETQVCFSGWETMSCCFQTEGGGASKNDQREGCSVEQGICANRSVIVWAPLVLSKPSDQCRSKVNHFHTSVSAETVCCIYSFLLE